MHHNTDFIPYEAVSSVMIHTPLTGFSSITFYAYGREIRVIVVETQNFASLQAVFFMA
ncbi:MAG: hypothetical protein SPL42_06070 [Bacteroidales bacterium]|nr:hypothetical protein [Bacteroidales bacterium]MDY6347979.1 hypothetical protein [Bacteroidales bacterium]